MHPITQPRAVEILSEMSKKLPQIWSALEEMRSFAQLQDKWPDWCYMPIGAIYSSFGKVEINPIEKIKLAYELACLAAWRMTKGIYRFDPDIYQSLLETSLEGDLPSDLFMQMPEWCIYLEMPNFNLADGFVYGAFVHLEFDLLRDQIELRILLDTEEKLVPLILHLGPWSIQTALAKALNTSIQNGKAISITDVLESTVNPKIVEITTGIVSLLLYLLTQKSEITNKKGETPHNPLPTKTKKGFKLFPANGSRQWDVGVRMGQTIRSAANSSSIQYASIYGVRSSPRPHIRRAHWHLFWTGPKPNQTRKLNWIPPTLIASDSSELPAVIRKVE